MKIQDIGNRGEDIGGWRQKMLPLIISVFLY